MNFIEFGLTKLRLHNLSCACIQCTPYTLGPFAYGHPFQGATHLQFFSKRQKKKKGKKKNRKKKKRKKIEKEEEQEQEDTRRL